MITDRYKLLDIADGRVLMDTKLNHVINRQPNIESQETPRGRSERFAAQKR